ncbi:MAG: hypothetical protein A2504_13445 [Bdellovibrionales bacterium RIFOXYD12_FULL_39_22]|nr:MAG: hypothetical protein A2385_01245 [Bdellovibrionales bacterium RIFOXYB1_FULL_39_21]OFZ43631.1 MAG: hypothetical protein A2485_12915 [Bdellovibrionales bacterium RIFOXYC12_FULL_39_17]OFZ44650.1 MAG: hypothetical protein A2404_10605 [Bdellovibrionales bacterium RIFOXYC1_FULL_39_130]OFZ73058.1 MAG: hypothetical protein A2451_16120 [Bdellovibrionales bacterium RIFOXYC2_FULL_39_8]OFZ76409.1 MAG: hypothetical protein A2560_07225 [Bdellovibrionales bacterium RIFOXYD1_FULL_39_84]OFZ94675.1 MAG:
MEKTFNLQNILHNTFLFSNLDSTSIEQIAAESLRVDIVRGELLFSDGMEALAFFVLINGMIKIYKISDEGSEQILHIHQSGDIIAEGAIFDKQKYPANGIALQNCTLVKIPKDAFVSLIMKNPEVALKIMGSYSRRLRMFVSMIEDFTLKDLEQRLVKYIIRNSKKKGAINYCELNVSKKELASLLGTIPETLSRALTGLKNKGYLTESEGVFAICDLEKFQTLL